MLKSEAKRYLELASPPMSTDVLEWWAEHEIDFPALSVMARQYLGVPATSASAERLFSALLAVRWYAMRRAAR